MPQTSCRQTPASRMPRVYPRVLSGDQLASEDREDVGGAPASVARRWPALRQRLLPATPAAVQPDCCRPLSQQRLLLAAAAVAVAPRARTSGVARPSWQQLVVYLTAHCAAFSDKLSPEVVRLFSRRRPFLTPSTRRPPRHFPSLKSHRNLFSNLL